MKAGGEAMTSFENTVGRPGSGRGSTAVLPADNVPVGTFQLPGGGVGTLDSSAADGRGNRGAVEAKVSFAAVLSGGTIEETRFYVGEQPLPLPSAATAHAPVVPGPMAGFFPLLSGTERAAFLLGGLARHGGDGAARMGLDARASQQPRTGHTTCGPVGSRPSQLWRSASATRAAETATKRAAPPPHPHQRGTTLSSPSRPPSLKSPAAWSSSAAPFRLLATPTWSIDVRWGLVIGSRAACYEELTACGPSACPLALSFRPFSQLARSCRRRRDWGSDRRRRGGGERHLRLHAGLLGDLHPADRRKAGTLRLRGQTSRIPSWV